MHWVENMTKWFSIKEIRQQIRIVIKSPDIPNYSTNVGI